MNKIFKKITHLPILFYNNIQSTNKSFYNNYTNINYYKL